MPTEEPGSTPIEWSLGDMLNMYQEMVEKDREIYDSPEYAPVRKLLEGDGIVIEFTDGTSTTVTTDPNDAA